MKPIIILPPDTMNSTHMEMLRKNGFCVVVAVDPAKVRFLDPIPAQSSRTQIEDAAIRLSRKLLNPGCWNTQTWTSNDDGMRQSISKMFCEILIKGSPLDKAGTPAEQEQVIINATRRDELERITREEVRAERAAKKAKPVETPK